MFDSSMLSRLAAEALGTFVLVLGGCGTALLTAASLGDAGAAVRYLATAIAFGLTVLTMAAAFGHISGGHFNPAVTLGAALAGRVEWAAVLPYWLVQIVAATAAGAVLLGIASGAEGFDPVAAGMATNGYGEASPGHFSLVAVIATEVILTAVFVWVILGVTDQRAIRGQGPLAIGLTLTLIHLISIPVDSTSVNPARSLGVAFFEGGTALSQVWVFVVAPLVGAAIAGATYNVIFVSRTAEGLDASLSAEQDSPEVEPGAVD